MVASSGAVRVLVVDDNALVREGLLGLFEPLDDVDIIGQAETGEEAVQLAAELEPDVVLMDLSLPGSIDGLAATRQIRLTNDHVRVMVLTAASDPGSLIEAMRDGVDGFLLKDIEPRALIAAVRAVGAQSVGLAPAPDRMIAWPRPPEL